MSSPLRILGAGPAGIAAAITLARAGRGVEIIERRPDCGAQFRGDLQGLENWTAKRDALDTLEDLGLGRDLPCTPFRTAAHTNGRTTLHHRFDQPIFYLVKRGTAADTLDQWLKARALAEGVVFRFGETMAPAAADIIATGPDSRRAFAVDTGIVFETDAPDCAVVLTDDRAAVKGYAYLLVANGYGCLCAMLFDRFRDANACLAQARAVLPAAWGVRIENPRPVGGVGYFASPGVYRRGRALVAGEAAGIQDFLWGFGIRTALASGHLAARTLLEGLDYEAEVERTFGTHLRAGVVNRLLWEALRIGNYRLAMQALHVGGRPLLRALYGGHPLLGLLHPIARRWAGRRYPIHTAQAEPLPAPASRRDPARMA